MDHDIPVPLEVPMPQAAQTVLIIAMTVMALISLGYAIYASIRRRDLAHIWLFIGAGLAIPYEALGDNLVHVYYTERGQIGWVTTFSNVAELDYPVLSPEDPSMVSVFLNKTLESLPKDDRTVIMGDFLDNMIPYMDESLFYKFYSDVASAARILNHTVIFIVKADIHSEVDINVVKRFADVIIENREREKKGKLVREVRVSNRVDNIHTGWEKY